MQEFVKAERELFRERAAGGGPKRRVGLYECRGRKQRKYKGLGALVAKNGFGRAAKVARKGDGKIIGVFVADLPGGLGYLLAGLQQGIGFAHTQFQQQAEDAEQVQVAQFCYVAEESAEAKKGFERICRRYLETFADACTAWQGRSSDQYPGYDKMVASILATTPDKIIAQGGAFVGSPDEVAKQGSSVTDELAEAAALQRIPKKRLVGEAWHTWLERKPVQLTVLATVAILIGGIIQIVPTILVKSNIPTLTSVKPYTPLELEGRDIYIREGCVSCHSQMVRPFRSEVERYGEFAKAGEFVYDHPFLWGSKRTGPDLLRVGGKYSDNWHFNHMYDPQSTSAGSIMPGYKWLITDEHDRSDTEAKMKAMAELGVPYSEEEIANAQQLMDAQASRIEQNLYNDPDFVKTYEADKRYAEENGLEFVEMKDREIVALIAYIQRLGTDIKIKDPETSTSSN